MAFSYIDIEDSIVNRLVSKLPGSFEIIPMPQKQSEFTIGNDTPLILVAYIGSDFDPPKSSDSVVQNETISVFCNIKALNLRGSNGIHEAVRLIKQYLVGFKPANLSKLYLEKIEFDERNEQKNFFSYNVSFKGTKLNVEEDESVDGPNLVQVKTRLSGIVDETIPNL